MRGDTVAHPFVYVSHDCQVRVLAHNQSAGSGRTSALVPFDIADLMVQRMAAERISRRVIRLFSPDSIFLPAKDFPQTHRPEEGEPLNQPSPEIHGLHFKPADPARQKAMYRADALAVLEEYVWA